MGIVAPNLNIHDEKTAIQILQSVNYILQGLTSVLKEVEKQPDAALVGIPIQIVSLMDSMLDDYVSALAAQQRFSEIQKAEDLRKPIHEAVVQVANMMHNPGEMAYLQIPVPAVKESLTCIADYNQILRSVYPKAARLVHN